MDNRSVNLKEESHMRKIVLFTVAVCLSALALGVVAPLAAQVTGLYYIEVLKDDRVYVFNTPERF